LGDLFSQMFVVKNGEGIPVDAIGKQIVKLLERSAILVGYLAQQVSDLRHYPLLARSISNPTTAFIVSDTSAVVLRRVRSAIHLPHPVCADSHASGSMRPWSLAMEAKTIQAR
jgi:hypothetical protein